MQTERDMAGNVATYDERDNLIEITYKDGSWIKYQYNSMDRMIYRETSNGEREIITYQSDGVTSETFSVDFSTDTINRKVHFQNSNTHYHRILAEEYVNGKIRRRVVTEIFPESK